MILWSPSLYKEHYIDEVFWFEKAVKIAAYLIRRLFVCSKVSVRKRCLKRLRLASSFEGKEDDWPSKI
jgi:hypothetical protein